MADAGRGKPDFSQRRPTGSLLPVIVVAGCVVALGVVVVSCAGAAGIFALVAIGGVIGFVALHYLLWGAWLGNKLRQSREADREADE